MGYLGDLPAGLAGCAACSADCTARLAAQGIRAIILPSLSVTLDATPCLTAPMISSAAFKILQGKDRALSDLKPALFHIPLHTYARLPVLLSN